MDFTVQQQQQLNDQVFIMKIVELKLMGGKQTINVLALRQKPLISNALGSAHLLGNNLGSIDIKMNVVNNQNYGSINENMDCFSGPKQSN